MIFVTLDGHTGLATCSEVFTWCPIAGWVAQSLDLELAARGRKAMGREGSLADAALMTAAENDFEPREMVHPNTVQKVRLVLMFEVGPLCLCEGVLRQRGQPIDAG